MILSIAQEAPETTWMIGIIQISVSSSVVLLLFFLARWFERIADQKRLLRECYSDWYRAMNQAIARILRAATLGALDKSPDSSVPAEQLLDASDETNVAMMHCLSEAVRLSLVEQSPDRSKLVAEAMQTLAEFNMTDTSTGLPNAKPIAAAIKAPIDHLIKSADAR